MGFSKMRVNVKVPTRPKPLIRRASADSDGSTLERRNAPQTLKSYYMLSKVRKFVPKEVWLENSINTIVDDLLTIDGQRKITELSGEKFVPFQKLEGPNSCDSCLERRASLSLLRESEPESNSLTIGKQESLLATAGNAAPIQRKTIEPLTVSASRESSEQSSKNNPPSEQKFCKLICSKSLDCDIKQKYKKYKYRSEICVPPFKNIFSKKSAVNTAFSGNSKMNENALDLNTRDKLPNVENSGFHFSEKEMIVIDKTRNQLREQISLIRSKNEAESRKIQLNIFLKPENDSFEVHESAEYLDERTNELLESVRDVMVEEKASIIAQQLAEFSFTQPETSDEGCEASEELSVDPNKDVQTLMSLRCPSPDLSMDYHNKVSHNLDHRNIKLTNGQGESGAINKEPATSKMKFLKTLIKESKYYVSPTKISAKGFKPASFRIETELMPANLSGSSESNISAIATQRNHCKHKMNNPTTPQKRNILEQNFVNCKAELNTSSDVAVFNGYQDYQVTQAFRKKLEESKELHRRLHFRGVNVSKETIIRALLSPAQIKMYENLNQSI